LALSVNRTVSDPPVISNVPRCSQAPPFQVKSSGAIFWSTSTVVGPPVTPLKVYGALLARDVPRTHVVETRYVPAGKPLNVHSA